MSTVLLSYERPEAGSATILVDVPDIPVVINIFDSPEARVGIVLATPRRQAIQVGPDDRRNDIVKVRSVDSDASRRTMKIGGAFFSRASNSGGMVMQCAGDLTMGGSVDPGLTLAVPEGSTLDMRGHGSVRVYQGDQLMTLGDAVGMNLIRVQFNSES